MRKFLLSATVFTLVSGFVCADIQAPPGSTYTASRKLGRGISNILFGLVEIPEQIVRKTDAYGRKAGSTYGLVDGTARGLRRIGYGFYEVFTFACPTFHGTFKQPYMKCGQDNRIEMNVHDGLSEFPPELGFETYFSHSRTQRF